MNNFWPLYKAMRDAIDASKDLADVLRVIEARLLSEKIAFIIIEPSDDQIMFQVVSDSHVGLDKEEFPTFIQAFDYLLTKSFENLKTKNETPH